MLEGNGNGAQIQICFPPVHRSTTSEIWHYPVLKMKPVWGGGGDQTNWICPGVHFSHKEVKQQADPRLWQPVKGEDQVEISEVWLFMLAQGTITSPWDFYRGKLVMFEVFNHFLPMFTLVLNLLCNVYIALSRVESQFSFRCGHSPLHFKQTPCSCLLPNSFFSQLLKMGRFDGRSRVALYPAIFVLRK